MTPRRHRLAAALVLLAVAFVPRSTPATTYQWDGGLSLGSSADDNWSTANNWTGGVAPSSSLTDTDVAFLAATGRTTSNNDFASPGGIAIHSLTFNAGATAYTLTGNTIYLGAGGLVQNSTAAQTFSANVSLAASESLTFGAGAGSLIFGGGLTIADGGSLTVNTAGIQFGSGGGLTVGGSNASGPSGNQNDSASALTLTGGVTLSPASVTIGLYGNATNTLSQDSGVLNTGSINLGVFSSGTFHLSGTGQVSATSLTVGAIGSGTFLQDNGTVTTNGGALIVGDDGSGTYTINAGSVSTGSMTVGYSSASGTFSQNGGTVTVTNGLGIGADGSSQQSTYSLGGGKLTVGSIDIGYRGVGAFIQTGGSVVASGGISLGGESSGSYTLSGAMSSASATSVIIGTGLGTALLTVDSGSLSVTGSAPLTVGYSGGSGAFIQNGGSVVVAHGGVGLGEGNAPNGIYYLNGGTLTTGSIRGEGTLNFNGGTLQANAASTTFMTGLANAYVQAGGAKIDSNGFNITVPQALVHDLASLGSALDGGLTKLGLGTLTLSAANTYNGGTLIAGGMLEAAANGALGTGNVTLEIDGTSLRIDANVTNAIADSASLSLDSTAGGKLDLLGAAGTIQETVASLDINGVVQAPGTYGATGSGAQFIDDNHFSGTGILFVAVPEPGTGVLAGAGMLLAALRKRVSSRPAAGVVAQGRDGSPSRSPTWLGSASCAQAVCQNI